MDKCSHKITGSSSPGGVYMFVVCMDCREILAESELGKRLRQNCPGWQRDEPFGHHCKHCHHDADYHIKILTERVAKMRGSHSAGEQHGS